MAPLPPQPGVHHQGQALLLRLGHPQALLQVPEDYAKFHNHGEGPYFHIYLLLHWLTIRRQ